MTVMSATFRFVSIFSTWLAVGGLGVAWPVFVSSAAIAADVSPWHGDIQSAARLVAAQARDEAGSRMFRAGVEIKLKNGWKTYWRYPGDSGVPPALDFSKSDNVKTVTVLYPAPARFPDGAGGSSIGYKGDVIFPVHVVPQDAAKPVTLRLKLDYAACEKLCMPAEAQLELTLTGAGGANESAIDGAEERVPKLTKVGDGGVPAIRAVRREAGPGKPRVVVDVAAPDGKAPVLFAEGPTAEWALPLPEPVAGAPAGLHRFAFDLDGLPPGEKARGATLRLTAVAGDKAVEAAFRLD
jgi:DsbC/DsbD-like thiol-disulfide interchange protein